LKSWRGACIPKLFFVLLPEDIDNSAWFLAVMLVSCVCRFVVHKIVICWNNLCVDKAFLLIFPSELQPEANCT